MIEMHAGEINQLQQLNLTQQSRIKEMTLQSTHLEERDRRQDFGNEQMQLRAENMNLQLQNTELSSKIDELVTEMQLMQEQLNRQALPGDESHAYQHRPDYATKATSMSPTHLRAKEFRTRSDSPMHRTQPIQVDLSVYKNFSTLQRNAPQTDQVFTFRQTSPRQNQRNDHLSTVRSQRSASELMQEAKALTEKSQRMRSAAKDWGPLLQEVKSALFDLVSEFRESWESDAALKREYDRLIKGMVLFTVNQSALSSEEAPVMAIVDLIQDVVGVFRNNLEYQRRLNSKKEGEVEEKQFELTASERDLRKRIDIVFQVFKNASTRLTRIDREWQEVLDAQVYIIEELMQATDQAEPQTRKDKGQTPLDIAISDFQFTLNKAIESLVTQENFDKTISQKLVYHETTGESLGTFKDVEINRAIVQQMYDVYDEIYVRSKQEKGNSQGQVNLKITTVAQFRSYSVRMIKALKEDLVKIQNEFAQQVNVNIDVYLAQKEQVQTMPEAQLKQLAQQMNQDLLDLRTNELYIRKMSSYVEAFKEAFEFCDVELASQCFPNCKGTNQPVMGGGVRDQAQQFVQVLQDQIDTIVKESRGVLALKDPCVKSANSR